MTEEKLKKIIDFYGFKGTLKNNGNYGNGHINDTILLEFDNDGVISKYVLQKINKYVFHHPDELMQNMKGITEHLKNKVAEAGGDPSREVLTIVYAKDGSMFWIDENEDYWRVTEFIGGASSHDIVEKPEDFYITGLAFGKFQSQLSDYPADTLYYTIPGFHDTRARYNNFLKTVEADKAGRVSECADEIKFILDRKDLAYYSMDSYDKGELPIRVTHNDTKLNNLLLDDKTGEAICVLDLDTVMPGFAMTDFGDAIRTGACTALEDEPDVDKVHCDLTLYEAFAKGFIKGCDGKLTDHEIDTLPMGALGITYEQALRFLADYLEGDVYYKTAYPEHNLVRTHTQIRMVEEMEAKWDQIQEIIKRNK